MSKKIDSTTDPGVMGDYELREQDKWLPIANVCRIMKNSLPDNAKISKEAKECMQECVSEFVSFITSEASEKCCAERRKTVNGEDILFAMTSLGFENYAEVLKIYLAKYRVSQNLRQEQIAAQRRKARQLHNRHLKKLQEQRALEEQQQQPQGNKINYSVVDYGHYTMTEAQITQQQQRQKNTNPDFYENDNDKEDDNDDDDDDENNKSLTNVDPRYHRINNTTDPNTDSVILKDGTYPEHYIFHY